MSFSKAPVKRFNEHVGCAPPPGAYDVRQDELKGAASFDKSVRFRPVKPAAATFLLPPSPSSSSFMSPVRRTMSVDRLVDSAKKEKTTMSVELKQQKMLEKEVRSLVQQRGEQDRRLLALEEDLKKAEAKLLAAVREKTTLSANVTTLQRQRAELKKVNEFLKNKVSADASKKRINSLTMELMEARNTLDVKNRELSLLHVNAEGQMNALETDLKVAKDTVKSLKERNVDLEDLHQVTKSQIEDAENENAKLQAVIRELREEIQVLQGYLDVANEQILDLRLRLQETEKATADCQTETVQRLQSEMERQIAQLDAAKEELRQKEEEALHYRQDLDLSKDVLREMEMTLESQELDLKSSQKSVKDLEEQMMAVNKELQASHATVRQQEAELSRLREVLRRTENELDQRVAHLEQRSLFAEEDRSKTQKEGLRRVEELKAELNSLREAKKEEEKKQIQLQEEHTAVSKELSKEKALVDSLTVLLMQEREESEQKMGQLKEELEEVLGELAVLEEEELRRRGVISKNQEEMEKLLTDNMELEKELLGNTTDVDALKREHLAAMTELKEEHRDSLNKMEAAVSELQRTKEALIKRQQELEGEVQTVTRELEEMDKVIQEKEDEIKGAKDSLKEHLERLACEEQAKDENARKLLEVRTSLVQKDEEMKAMEENGAARIGELQWELERLKRKGDALGQLEAQMGQTIAQLESERETACKQAGDAAREKEEVLKRAEREEEQRVEMELALKTERGALEDVRKDCELIKAEATRLQAQIQQISEEKGGIMSQLEQSRETQATLEERLKATEQDKNELEARLVEAEKEEVCRSRFAAEVEEKLRLLKMELEEQKQERRALKEQVEVLTQEKVTLQWEMEEQRQELNRQIIEAQEQSAANAEVEHWRSQYEELLSKVGPFQEQLNAFAAEKNALLNENGANQEELNKLSDAYARLMGHQNQRQKIKHVVKLKDENLTLKQEVSKLRALVSRQKSEMEQLKWKLPGAQRRFDPSQAFQHDKENSEASKPLREGNRQSKRSFSTD
ncbi:hyaluronan mediated motility receptor [Eucyclogobius newberryi]|uniref:hyaluronan mediated motility receptor n=1 Tax=Eucyclogobius newberryi TaxID=166745 RepID=UPI003B5C6792